MSIVPGAALASIPSPCDGVLHLGPIPLHMYGLMIAIGVLVAVEGRRRSAGSRRGHGAKAFSTSSSGS